MARFFKNRELTVGRAPGSLVFIGEQKSETTHVRLIEYGPDSLTDHEVTDLAEERAQVKGDVVSWINVNGLHEESRMREVGDAFALHSLLLEDVLNTGQRPKLEEYEDVVFIVVKMLRLDEDGMVHADQLSIVLGDKHVLTFQEYPGDVFEPVRNRIRNSLGRIRDSGPDYLAYALLDTVVDNYIAIIERLGSSVEDLEVEVLTDSSPGVLNKISELKRELTYFRKAVRPAREAMLRLSKLDSALIRPATGPFLKDLHDISTQATDAIEVYREMLSDELNIYNSTISNKMNDIMRVLTIFAAIFIPLTFIAGVYGTNFENLPELHYEYSYYIFLSVMVAVALGMLVFFRRRGWL